MSYTAETLKSIHDSNPEAELYFLMGSDSLADLPTWHLPREICQLASLLVVKRPESSTPSFDALADLVDTQRLLQMDNIVVDMPLTSISSSDIRKKIVAEEDWQALVPKKVADYIEKKSLYR